jgi:hypothetical protein
MARVREVADRDGARSVLATSLTLAFNGSRGHCPWREVQEGSALLVGSGAKPRRRFTLGSAGGGDGIGWADGHEPGDSGLGMPA